ncbi:MAG: hypothetical protein H7296_04530, partial [Bacteroidia bacterium]|nr:hypothetical protein [Bacteroidia bacterium]
MSQKISQLPLYVGTSNPVGEMPISILGTTYRILSQVFIGAYSDYYKGTLTTRVLFEASVARPLKGMFGFIYDSTTLELAIYNGSIWNYFDLSGGGGGAQTLDQTLANGNTAINKEILLEGANPNVFALLTSNSLTIGDPILGSMGFTTDYLAMVKPSASVLIKGDNLVGDKLHQFPNGNGTYALSVTQGGVTYPSDIDGVIALPNSSG